MAVSIQRIKDGYDYVFSELSDPKASEYYLMDSPFLIISLVSVYYYFIYYGGVRMMKNRKPYKLEKILLLFNGLQVLANAYLTYRSYQIFSQFEGRYHCMFITDNDTSLALELKTAGYLYFLLKVSDLADTIFMVLKKNYHQVTFLHVYHHIGMVVASWAMIKFSRGSQEGIVGALNVHVHVIMYTYYFISAKYPKFKKYLWIKKMITQAQLLQFVIIFIHNLIAFVNPNCVISKWHSTLLMTQSSFMIYLFSQFYYRAYIKPLKKKEKEIESKKQ